MCDTFCLRAHVIDGLASAEDILLQDFGPLIYIDSYCWEDMYLLGNIQIQRHEKMV